MENFGPLPIFGGVDVVDQVSREEDGLGTGAEGGEIVEEGPGASPIELAGVVVGFFQVLGAGQTVFRIEHFHAVGGSFEGALDGVGEAGGGEGEVEGIFLEHPVSRLQILLSDKRRGGVDAAGEVGVPQSRVDSVMAWLTTGRVAVWSSERPCSR